MKFSNELMFVSPGTVSITITDFNDNVPEFVPSDTYSISVPEGLVLTSNVMTFTARDKDKNQVISYSMDSDPYGNFDIGTSTGRSHSQRNKTKYESYSKH